MNCTWKHYKAIMRGIKIGVMAMTAIMAISILTVAPISLARAGTPGAYIGLGLGASQYEDGNLKDVCAGLGTECGTEGVDLGLELFAGYQFNPYISLEGGWANIGEISAQNELVVVDALVVDANGFFLAVVPEYPFNEYFSIYGRLGLMYADVSVEAGGETFAGLSGKAKASEWHMAFNYGIGVMLHLDRWDFRLQVSRTDFNNTMSVGNIEVDVPEANMLSLAVVFRFPR